MSRRLLELGCYVIGFGFPVVLKLCGETIAHKTERGLGWRA